MFNFAIDLCQGLLTAHGQHGMPKSYEQDHKRKPTDPCVIEPSERFVIDRNDAGMQRVGRYLDRNSGDSDDAPKNQDDHHHRSNHHDLDGLFAGLVYSLYVLVPKINDHQGTENCGECVLREGAQRMPDITSHVFDKASQVLAGHHRTDRASQDVVKQQGGN